MTIGNDPAQQKPDDQQQQQQQPVAAAAPAAADPAIAEAAARMQADPDLIELSTAIEAAKVEEAAKTAAAGAEKVEGIDPAQAASATEKPGEQKPAATAKPADAAPIMIPKQRFDEVNGRVSKAEQDAAYWRGVAEARAQPAPKPGEQQQQQQQPKPEDRLAAIHAKQDEIATKFDNGEITLADVTKQQRALAADEQAIREEVLLAKVPKPTADAQPGNNELYLDSMTAQIERDHPMVMAFDQVGSETDWNIVKSRAMENLTARGIDPTKGDIGKYNLRKEMAVVIDELGPSLIGAKAKLAGIELPNGQPSSQGQQQQQQKPANGSPEARAAKLALAAGAPPNISTARTSGDDPAAPTDSRIETMSDEEIAALPVATRNKLLGVTSA